MELVHKNNFFLIRNCTFMWNSSRNASNSGIRFAFLVLCAFWVWSDNLNSSCASYFCICICSHPTTYGLIWYIPNSSYYIWAHLVSPKLILLHMGSFGISQTYPFTYMDFQTHPTIYGLIWYLPNSSFHIWAHLVSPKLILSHIWTHLVSPKFILPHMSSFGISQTTSYYIWAHLQRSLPLLLSGITTVCIMWQLW